MLYEALPHRLVTNRAIARDGTTTAVADELNLSVLLQREGHRTVFATNDIHTILFFPTIVGIIGKDQTTDAQLWAFKVLNPQEEVATHLEKFQP